MGIFFQKLFKQTPKSPKLEISLVKRLGEYGINMKANRKFRKDNEGVSAVIGVILMVAITVAIAATVYVYVSGMLPGTSSTTPNISWTVDTADNTITVTKGTNNAYGASATVGNLVFKNATGETWYVADTMALTNASASLEENDISAGDVISGFFDGEWTMIWEPTNTVIGTVDL